MDKYKIYPQSNSLTKIVADTVYWIDPMLDFFLIGILKAFPTVLIIVR